MAHLTQTCRNVERLSIYATEDDLKTMESLFDFLIDAMQVYAYMIHMCMYI